MVLTQGRRVKAFVLTQMFPCSLTAHNMALNLGRVLQKLCKWISYFSY